MCKYIEERRGREGEGNRRYGDRRYGEDMMQGIILILVEHGRFG